MPHTRLHSTHYGVELPSTLNVVPSAKMAQQALSMESRVGRVNQRKLITRPPRRPPDTAIGLSPTAFAS